MVTKRKKEKKFLETGFQVWSEQSEYLLLQEWGGKVNGGGGSGTSIILSTMKI